MRGVAAGICCRTQCSTSFGPSRSFASTAHQSSNGMCGSARSSDFSRRTLKTGSASASGNRFTEEDSWLRTCGCVSSAARTCNLFRRGGFSSPSSPRSRIRPDADEGVSVVQRTECRFKTETAAGTQGPERLQGRLSCAGGQQLLQTRDQGSVFPLAKQTLGHLPLPFVVRQQEVDEVRSGKEAQVEGLGGCRSAAAEAVDPSGGPVGPVVLGGDVPGHVPVVPVRNVDGAVRACLQIDGPEVNVGLERMVSRSRAA